MGKKKKTEKTEHPLEEEAVPEVSGERSKKSVIKFQTSVQDARPKETKFAHDSKIEMKSEMSEKRIHTMKSSKSVTIGPSQTVMEIGPSQMLLMKEAGLEGAVDLALVESLMIPVKSTSKTKKAKKKKKGKKGEADDSKIDVTKSGSHLGVREDDSRRSFTKHSFSSSILAARGSSHKSGFLKSKSVISGDYSSSSSSEEEEVHREPSRTKRSRLMVGKKGKGKGKKETGTKSTEDLKTEEEAEEKPKKGKKEKKEKKGKKKKEKEEKPAEPEEPKPEVDDFMAEIMRLKAAAMGEEIVTEEVVVKPKKKSKGPKKKMSKKEKAKMTAELAEKMRIEAEQEAARQAELERIRLEEERKAAIEKEKREINEQQLRIEQLEGSCRGIVELINYNNNLAKEEKEELEWQLYVACGRLPNPSKCDEMNTLLHLWEHFIELTTVKEASKRTSDIIKLMGDLEDILDTCIDEDARKIENWKWVRQLFRDYQRNSLDVATYRLLRNVEKHLHRIDIPTADFDFKDEHIKASIWLRVQLPIPLPNPRRPPKPRIEVNFENVEMQVYFPVTIDCENMAVRAMYLKYDHLSDLSDSFHLPNAPQELNENLLEITKKEWRTKLKYKYQHRDKKRKKSIEITEVTEGDGEEVKKEEKEEKEEFESDEDIPIVPYKKLEPTSSEFATANEDRFYAETRKNFLTIVDDNVINLRKYCILGGVYHLNLVFQPPQPQDFITMEMNITALYIPKKLEHVPYAVIYTPPTPPEAGVRRLPEEIEEEMKRQEEEMDKLMLITITWPQHVIFLELPIVCHWNEENKLWSKKDIHDLKHNEEKGLLSFRTGVFGIFGLAGVRYANLPFQAWELKPEVDGSVTLQIMATILILEFNVKNGLVCISQLQNSPNNALQNIVGVYFKLHKLKRIMKEAGIDVFPEPDAFCYIEGSCEKHWPMERHLYYCMAKLHNSFNFAWSRWNLTAGRRNIVLQMREYSPNKTKQKNHSMLLVTPLKATFVDCTEVSQIFCDDDVELIKKFCADLYHLMKVTSSITIRKNVQSSPLEVVYALSELLISTRVLSFS